MKTPSSPFTRFMGASAWAPFTLGLFITIAVLLARFALDGFFLLTWGIPPGYEPLWQSSLWWPEIVNAVLIGFIPAALVIAGRGVDHDLQQLRPRLPCSDAEVVDIRSAVSSVGYVGRAFTLSWVIGGAALVFADPSLTRQAEPSLTNPAFLWHLFRIPVFSWMIATLIVFDFNAARTYLHMGRHLIKVDLLDIPSLSPIARRGLRSALTWVVFSIIFSLFWLGEDTASEQNMPLLAIVLTMATATFIVPLIGVHNNILAVKQAELDRLRDQIRVEHVALTNQPPGQQLDSPRLANHIAYYQLIERAREWPIDAASLLKFLLYLFIGLGSWLGGAVVERLLERSLSL